MFSLQKFNALIHKMWQKNSIYLSRKGQEVFKKLLINPKSTLAEDEKESFAELQELLLDPNSNDTGQLVIFLTILYLQKGLTRQDSFGKYCAEKIRDSLQNGETRLNLEQFDLPELNMISWAALIKAVEKSPLTGLAMTETSIVKFNDNQYKAFLSLISLPQLTEVYLGVNHLFEMSVERVLACFQRLRSLTKLETLDLYSTYLTNQYVAPFCELIIASPVKKLDFGGNLFHEFDEASWKAFWIAVNSSKLNTLNLEQNELVKLSDGSWEAFCDGIEHAHLEYLDLHQNELDKLTDDRLKRLLQALSRSMIVGIKLVQEEPFSTKQWELIIEELRDNFTLQRLKFLTKYDKDDTSEKGESNVDTLPVSALKFFIRKLLKRNKFIADCQNEAHILLQEIESSKKELAKGQERTDEKVKEIAIVFKKLQNAINLLEGGDSISADRNRSHILQLMDELLLQKATLLIHLKEIEKSVDLWLEIAPVSPYYLQARINAFEETYLHNFNSQEKELMASIEESRIENEVLTQRQVAFRRSAFLQALPCLLEEQELLHKGNQNLKYRLTDPQQKTFDNFLFAAAGGCNRYLSWGYTPNERLALLQNLILLDITDADSPVLLIEARKDKALFDPKDLPLLRSIQAGNCNVVTTQSALHALWGKLVTIVNTLLQQDQDVQLVNAINHLSIITAKNSAKTETTSEAPKTNFFKDKKVLPVQSTTEQSSFSPGNK